MKKKYGFTLIELLAVIVVLAVIALIATPIILGVIDKAKLGAAKESATGYVKSMEDAIVLKAVNMSEAYKCSNFTIAAENVEFVPLDQGEDTPAEWKNVTNVKQALDYLYGV